VVVLALVVRLALVVALPLTVAKGLRSMVGAKETHGKLGVAHGTRNSTGMVKERGDLKTSALHAVTLREGAEAN